MTWTLTNIRSYSITEQITSSFLITNTPGNFCKQFYFFCSSDTKLIVSTSGTPLFSETNINNKSPRSSPRFYVNLRNGFSTIKISENRNSGKNPEKSRACFLTLKNTLSPPLLSLISFVLSGSACSLHYFHTTWKNHKNIHYRQSKSGFDSYELTVQISRDSTFMIKLSK